MSLLKSSGVIGGLTLVSRVAGFARDMIMARVLGAGMAADAFFLAFQLPNIFRRLFAEGAFSAAYVPMFSKRLHGPGGRESAEEFSSDVLSVFLPLLIVFTALVQITMPAVIWVMADDYQEVPGKFELTVALARITFPYIVLISLATLLTGILNSLSRFAPGASFPVLLNLSLIAALLIGDRMRGAGGDDATVAYALAFGVAAGGFLQLGWMVWWTWRAGIRLRIRRPRLSPEVKELGVIILPAIFGAGVYQVNQLVQLYFVTELPGGSLAYLNYADRLNQLPLGVIGIALGTAILPALSRHVGSGDQAGADRLQSSAIELALLLTIPAAAALAVCAGPFVTAFFLGGRFDPEDAAITSAVLTALVLGLPAYVLIKVLTPAFFSRKDTRTPVWAALAGLIFFILFNAFFLGRFGLVGLAASSAVSAWLNCIVLYVILVRRGLYRMEGALALRIGRQVVAAAAMAAVLWLLREQLAGWFAGSLFERVAAIVALVAPGAVAYFAIAWAVGAIDRSRLNLFLKRKV